MSTKKTCPTCRGEGVIDHGTRRCTECQDGAVIEFPSRLFIGVYPGGIVYADRWTQEDGDWKRLAFLDYATLKLKIEPDAPDEMLESIRKDAADLQARHGQQYPISSSGQTVLLGSALRSDEPSLESDMLAALKAVEAKCPIRHFQPNSTAPALVTLSGAEINAIRAVIAKATKGAL